MIKNRKVSVKEYVTVNKVKYGFHRLKHNEGMSIKESWTNIKIEIIIFLK